ncbi:14900_t:CDS:2, partial [Cetraspora pellucida]
ENNTNEILNDQEIVNLVTNVKPEINKSNDEQNDDSVEICQITHNEALNAIGLLEKYLFQQDFDIEVLYLRNVIDLNNYINYLEENNTNEILNDQEIVNLVTNVKPEINKSNDEQNDDSVEICQITHNEALNAIGLLEKYLFQQDFGDTF